VNNKGVVMRSRQLWIICLSAALAACDSPSSELEPQALERAARQTTSLCAEASLLTQQIEQGTVNEGFIWVHERALQDDALKVLASLHQAVPEQLRARQERILGIDAGLQAALDRVGLARANRAELQALKALFDQLHQQALSAREER
jgi:hypothetical protein